MYVYSLHMLTYRHSEENLEITESFIDWHVFHIHLFQQTPSKKREGGGEGEREGGREGGREKADEG